MLKRSQSTIIFYDTSCVFQNVLFPISQVLDAWFEKEDYMYSINFNMEKVVPYVDKSNHLQMTWICLTNSRLVLPAINVVNRIVVPFSISFKFSLYKFFSSISLRKTSR